MSADRKVTHAERVWLSFASSALGGLVSIDRMHDDRQCVHDATRLADFMTAEWAARFEPESVATKEEAPAKAPPEPEF